MTEQRKRFADRYFETLNGTQSAIYAGYSEATARQKAWELLNDPEVESYIQELRESNAQKHGISLDNWLSELKEVGYSNVQDFIDQGNTIKDISSIERPKAGAVSSVKKTVIEGEFGVKETVEFKLHDKLSALEKIGRHMGYFEKDNDQSKTVVNNVINLGEGVNPDAATD